MAYIERDCIFEHEGRKFESGGAYVSPEYVIGYVGDVIESGNPPIRALTAWHGERLGTIRLTTGWRLPLNCWVASHMYQAYATVNGVRYTGRTCGKGMIFKGRRCAKQE